VQECGAYPGGWPFRGDSPVVVARRVAAAYRARLALADAQSCAELDDLVAHRWGQTWAVPRIETVDAGDWLTPGQAADLASVKVDTIRQWRHRGRLSGVELDGRWWYLAEDIMNLGWSKRRREAAVTDTVVASGRSVPEGGA
jgi:hypothetical protein